MQGYRDAVDFMYSNNDALLFYEEFAKVPAQLMRKWRDDFFPKSTMWPDEVRGLDLVLADALKNKFVAAPLTPEQVRELVQIPRPLK
jgi:NitT/TauT family transport system substrate-binding protein